MSAAPPGPAGGLDGNPEGSGPTPTRIPSWAPLVAALFALYLLFRIVQGLSWLAHHL